MNALLIISSGVLTGILIATLYYIFFTENSEYNSKDMKQDYSKNSQVPKLWDGESKLVKCQNCECYNHKDYYICRICTSKLYDRKTINSKDIDGVKTDNKF